MFSRKVEEFLDGLLAIRDRLRVARGAATAKDAQGTPTQSHISPSILVYEDSSQHQQAPAPHVPLSASVGRP